MRDKIETRRLGQPIELQAAHARQSLCSQRSPRGMDLEPVDKIPFQQPRREAPATFAQNTRQALLTKQLQHGCKVETVLDLRDGKSLAVAAAMKMPDGSAIGQRW